MVRVVKSRGERISIAGSSFIVSKKTIIAPIYKPGLRAGMVTVRADFSGLLPKLMDDSSILGLICNILVLTVLSAAGRVKITQARIKIKKD